MTIDLYKNVEEFDLAFLDLETTGLDVVMGDAICEIGIYKVKDRKIIDKFHTLINPKKTVPEEAYRIHKISDKELQFAPVFEKIADKLISFLKDTVICAYNVGFDLGFIDQHLKAMDYPVLNLPALDILSMARDVLRLSRYNLESVAQAVSVDCTAGLHRALDDALVAYRVFFKLIDIFKQKNIEHLDEFICLYGFGNEIVKEKEAHNLDVIQEAIEKEKSLRLKYFSSQSQIKEETIIPLRILQENRCFYLLYQGPQDTSSRIRSNRILEIKAT